MASADNGLAGMRGVSVRLVNECVKRTKGLGRVLPVVIAFGGRGSGKSALRDEVLALAQLVGESTGLPGWVPSTADTLLQGLGWVQRRRLLNRLRHMSGDWRDPSHALIDLSKRTVGDTADQRSVDLKFCEAF